MTPAQHGADWPQNDASHPRLAAALTAEMSRLFSAGFSLLPLGGPDGKRPTIVFKDRKRLPLSLVVDQMANGGSSAYGIRLKGLMVVDVDTDTAAARSYVEQRFGSSPGRTRTSRGFHLYFRHSGAKPKQIRLPEIAIDFKAGENEFVVGPQSERPDGAIYWPEGRLISLADLPWFKDRNSNRSKREPEQRNAPVPVGSRNDMLKRRGRELVLVAHEFDSFLADLLAFRDWELEDPASFPDEQVRGLAEWFWHKRMSDQLWQGRNSAVMIKRFAMDDLVPAGYHLPLSLLVFLTAEHGHAADQPFAVDPDALRSEGHFRDGRKQLYAAIRVLCERGHLVLARKASGRRNYHQYRLAPASGGEQEKRGFFLY